MEHAVLLSGVGGQGVQLAAQVLAHAAAAEERDVMLLGTYGGTMRGGNTDCSLVVADGRIASPPILSRADAVIALHPLFLAPARAKLRADGLLLLDDATFEPAASEGIEHGHRVPATKLASEAGSALAAAMVLIGAFAGLTRIVGVESLVAAMREAVPPYRTQHLATNEAALRKGFEALPQGALPAWPTEVSS